MRNKANEMMKSEMPEEPAGLGTTFLLSICVVALGAACAGSQKVEPIAAAPVQPKVKTASEYVSDASSALEGGDYAVAIKAYDAVLQRDPDNAGIMYNRAYALHQVGDLDGAQAGYEKVLAAEPTSIDAAVNLGALLKEKGEVDRAIEVTKAALAQGRVQRPSPQQPLRPRAQQRQS